MNGYSTYKFIGLPWLPEIPAHWSVLRNKNIFSEVKDTVGSDSASYTLLSLTLKGIIPRDIESGKGKFPKDFDTYKIVKAGNMAFCLFDIDETPRTVGLSAYDGILTGAYTIFQVKNVNARYAFYYYLALDNVKAMRPLYSGLRKTINVGTFLATKFPLPSCEEQDKIVRYLDWQVSKINKLIAAKKKEIDMLKEYQKAEIERQLANFPAEAEIRLKQLGSFEKGGGFSRENLVDGDNCCPAILYGDIYTQYSYSTDIITHHIDKTAYDSSTKIKHGMIVLSGTGETKDEIGVLYELRTKLIFDVVTGQIDVRGIEVPEFEYVEEIEDNFDGDEELDEKSIENREDK